MSKMILVFNNDGSRLVVIQPYDENFETNLKSGNIKHKVLEYDIDNEYYWGDFSTGSIRSLNEQPLLEEISIEELVNKQILARYPVHKQLNIISKCLENAGIPLTSEFVEMRNWINTKADNHNSALQTYKDNPNIYSFVPKPELPSEE